MRGFGAGLWWRKNKRVSFDYESTALLPWSQNSTRLDTLTSEILSIQNFTIHYPLAKASGIGTGTEVYPGIPDSELSELYRPVEEFLRGQPDGVRKKLELLFQSEKTPVIFKAYLHLLVYQYHRTRRARQRACFSVVDVPDLKGRLSKEHTVCEIDFGD